MPLEHDPNEVKDYTLNWSGSAPGPRLATGETITTSTWTVPSGITKDSDTDTDTTTTIWLSGGTAGVSYRLTNHVVTSQGRQYDWSITVLVTSL
jgi:hypothetical protein